MHAIQDSTAIMRRAFCSNESRDSDPRVAMQRQIEIIGAAWGLGGADPGCAEAPAVLAPLLSSRLEAFGVPAVSGPLLQPVASERRRQFAVSKLCGELAAAVAQARRGGRLPC